MAGRNYRTSPMEIPMLFALVATDQDVARFSDELRAVITSLNGETSVVQPNPQPVEVASTQPVATATTTSVPNGDSAAKARAARALYTAFKNAYGRPPTAAEKTALKAGQPVAAFEGARVFADPPAAPAVDPAISAMQDGIAALQAQLAAATAGTPAPVAAPVAAAPVAAAQRFDSLPLASQLPPSVCAQLAEWSANLTPVRQQVIAGYAAGTMSPADVHSVYGEKVTKVVAKINALLKG